jgi:hypothetical protein
MSIIDAAETLPEEELWRLRVQVLRFTGQRKTVWRPFASDPTGLMISHLSAVK